MNNKRGSQGSRTLSGFQGRALRSYRLMVRGTFKKELRLYFSTMSGYVFAAVFWFLAGAYFLAANLVPQNGDIRAFFSSFFPTIMFMVPILTMRLYAEERKMKTDELLLTSPAALSGIMFGKFLAALAVFVAIMSLTAIFPLILAAFGASPSGVSDPLAVIGCFTGMVLMTSSLVAVGLWISVHSENQIAAATVTCAVFLTLHLLNGAGAIVGDRTAAALLSSLSPTGRFIHFANGIFDPADVVFYVSVTALFLFLSARAPDRKRLSAAFERQSRVILALSLCLFVLVNVFAWLAGQRFDVRFDMTGERLYAPSPPAIESVRSLFASGSFSGSSSGSSSSVVISVISDEESFPPVLREMLRRLEKLSPRIDVRYVDPWENPAFVNHYRQLGHAPGASDILVEGPSGVRLLRYGDLFVYRDKTVNGIREVHGIQLEQMLMSAMKSVIKNGASPRAAFTVGHNERPSGALKNLFSSNGCLVENLYVGAGVGLDPNADIIVLAGPSRDFSREEADALRDWLSKGGKLAAFLGPDGGPYPNLGGLLRDWNMELADGLVLEEKAYAAGSPVNVIPQYAPHPVNLYFVENPSYAVMPRARAIKIVGKGPGAFTPEALLVSTSGSFARSGSFTEKKVSAVRENDGVSAPNPGSLKKLPGDEEGPFILAAVSQRPESGFKPSVLFLAGSAGMYADDVMETPAYANRDFLTRVLIYLTDSAGSSQRGEDVAVAIPAKTLAPPLIVVTPDRMAAVTGVFSLLLPAAALSMGVWICLRRRNR